MTSLKTGYLLFLAAFLLLPIVPTVAEVVTSVSDCKEFLLDGTPPQVPEILKDGIIQDQDKNQKRYKPICQTYDNKKRFLTLYDTKNKIPVFSAYRYTGEETGTHRPNTHWKIEPQLENKDDVNKNMVDGDTIKTNNQAMNDDYTQYKTLDRGHLFPSSYGFTQSDKESTFTLTNIVPQVATFNQGSWARMEQCVKCVMDKLCINNNGHIEGFVVTGAKSGTEKLNRVNIPSMLWSAFCCYNTNNGKWFASAHWGDNVSDEPENKYMQTKNLEGLHLQLTGDDPKFNVFPNTNCPLDTTVNNIYPETQKDCKCPKQSI